MWRLVALCSIILTGCASGSSGIDYSSERDMLGNLYPTACLDESTVHPRIVFVPEAALQSLAGLRDRFVYGFWNTDFINRDGVVYINDELSARQMKDTMRHEFCHAVMYRLTGDPYWHR